ncbi:MAG: DNA polymerase III subunit gamma/tau, partial [Chloroflexi bacterium]|nr:DNA polymerase III subunit gamma/tau [Chloroflexota bacterium]
MSEVFYRKWRPKTLGQLVGQEMVSQTLRKAVALDRVAHAYLFCGPRGTGKTSTARILAKAVNCLSPVDGEPDNTCSICRSINEGHALDLIEIDAASNRGIDDIRNLSDKIHFMPNEARYKVYIIDEVHMLTKEAFNALLKTLEEPPSHAIFILATTEAHNVPLTVISRCQRFDFRRIPMEAMMGKLAELCREEGIEIAEEALRLIARAATGSLRDAENLLEQAVVSYDSPISEEQVRDLLEMGGDEIALELVGHIVNKSVRDGLIAINQVVGQGNDLRQLHRGVMDYLRGVLLLKSIPGPSLGYPEETTTRLKSLADAASMEHLVRALKNFAKADLRRDSSSPLPLELALVESCADLPVQAAPVQAAPVRQPVPTPRTAPAPSYSGTTQRPAAPVRAQAPVYQPPTAPPASVPNSQPQYEQEPAGALPTEPAARLESQWRANTRSLR